MNHKEVLLETYKHSYSIDDIVIQDEIKAFIQTIGEKIDSQKGVFTVLVTLITHKIIDKKQDIRLHQPSMQGGFSGRTIDANFITPTLKELGLPSMAESGWLTRSLEQPYPYNLNYNGKISNIIVKNAFLQTLHFVEQNPLQAKNILRLLLFEAINAKNRSIVELVPLQNPDKLTIEKIVGALNILFQKKYDTHGGSKLPVLAFYAIYQSLIKEISRYNTCFLGELGSHTASDRTSKTAGDIEIFQKEKLLYEAIEIKLDKQIDATIVRIAIEKIKRFNPVRYYILSFIGVKNEDKEEISSLLAQLQAEHGCQVIINGVLPTIKYYLRLINSLEQFINDFNQLIEKDTELKKIHKEQWNHLLMTFLN